VFLGHAHRGLEGLGIRNAPRGMRWWWATITGADMPAPVATRPGVTRRRQLALDLSRLDTQQAIDDVHSGWGD